MSWSEGYIGYVYPYLSRWNIKSGIIVPLIINYTLFYLDITAYGPKHAKKGVDLNDPFFCLTIIISEVPGSKAYVYKEEAKMLAEFIHA